jgi:hypothetical protein
LKDKIAEAPLGKDNLMKKISILSLLALWIVSNVSFSGTGKLFSAVFNGNTLTITPTANNYYPSMGIKFTSNTTVSGCTPSSNGFCLFAASPQSPKTLLLSGTANMIKGTGCLSGPAEYSCQKISANGAFLAKCNKAGGKFVSGSTACWLSMSGTSPDCSTTCSTSGLSPAMTVISYPLPYNICQAFIPSVNSFNQNQVITEVSLSVPDGSTTCMSVGQPASSDWTITTITATASTWFCPCKA